LIGDDFDALLGALIRLPATQALWTVSDRGMPVFAHSMDVALLCLDEYPNLRDRLPDFRLDVVLLGCVLHDLSKVSARHGNGLSHSYIMTHDPSIAVAEALTVLDAAQTAADVRLDPEGLDHLWHVIAAHHGRWGKVKPATPEAELLHTADQYSSIHHRIAPVDANDILPLIERGYRWPQIGELLGINRGIVKNRLQDACLAEQVRSSSELLTRWQERGAVLVGDDVRTRQIERARFLVAFSRDCPDTLLARLRPLFDSAAEGRLTR
jgi:hypothetical protein